MSFGGDPIPQGARFGRVEFVDVAGVTIAEADMTWDGKLKLACANSGPLPRDCNIAGVHLMRANGRSPIPFLDPKLFPVHCEAGYSFELRCDVTRWPASAIDPGPE